MIDVSWFKNSKRFSSYLRSALREANSNRTVKNRGTNKMGLVRTGLRRRVFTEIYQMLKKGERRYGREPEKRKMKTAQYRRFSRILCAKRQTAGPFSSLGSAHPPLRILYLPEI
jgi:hypothetical protein